MDRQITNKERNHSKSKNIIWILLSIIAFVALMWLLRSALQKKAKLSDFHVAQVERGSVQNTVTASGIVQAAFERELNAPVVTEISKIILPKGSIVKKGDLILELDQEYTQLEYGKLKDELELRRNNINKLKLQFDKNLRNLDYEDQIKAFKLEELQAQVVDYERLLEIGGATAEELERANINLKLAKIEKKMIENNLAFAKNVNVMEKKNLELEYKIQQKKLIELQRKLNETSVVAPLNGVITWINDDIGRTVSPGEPLVRIADLEQYSIDAFTSDRNTEKIIVGTPVNVRINNNLLKGSISTVLPEVENNTIKFRVELDNNNADYLRPNLRAEVYLITENKLDVLRIKNGAAFNGADRLEVFKIENGHARKIKIVKGISNSEYVELQSGNLKIGDRIIISNTEDYDHLDGFTIKNQN